jgi:Tol biopolymer transport system component
MALAAGARLGPYEILVPLGAGGMGEVYRARDTKLGREVAVKVLPEDFAHSEDRLARFEREARVLASLNHPHIATLYGFEQHSETRFIVMEMVEGEDLATRLRRGPLPLREALPLFLQVAEGLEAAHEKGVIHRDLKPANIKVSDEETVKILDFGLAKAMLPPSAAAESDLSQSPTQSATHRGEILGTAGYMSPEQARGKVVDRRADIWSFGCVLYEALSGRRAFRGETVTDTLAAVLEHEVDWAALPDDTPLVLRSLLRRCLRKDRDRRLHDIADARIEIEEVLAEPAGGLPDTEVAAVPRWRVVTWSLAMLASLAMAAGVWSLWRTSQQAPQLRRRVLIEVPDEEPVALTAAAVLLGQSIALSPNGTHLAYVAARDDSSELYLRSLDEFEASPIPGTEGALEPFFSPDGQWLGFFAENKLKKVSLSGGAALTLCEVKNPWGATWSEADTIFFADMQGANITGIPADGGTPEVVASGSSYHWPQALRGGNALLYNDYSRRIAVILPETGEERILLEGGTQPRYVPTGHLVYSREGGLLAVPFDLERLEVTGTPVSILDSVRNEGGLLTTHYTFSSDGSLVYVSGTSPACGRLVWVDREGTRKPLDTPSGFYGTFRLSPDGRWLAITVTGASDDVWIYDLERGTRSRLTLAGNSGFPVWSPDGKWVAFNSDRGGAWNLFRKPADGSGEAERLTTSENWQAPYSWSRDGERIVFVEWAETGGDIWVLSAEGDRSPEPFLVTRFSETAPALSPDGRWIAYYSSESGRPELYVQPFPGPGRRWQISNEGSWHPVWSPIGDEIFYQDHSRKKWMVSAVTTRPEFSAETPRLLFEGHYVDFPGRPYDVAPDGERFLLVESLEESATTTRLHVVLNWFDELKRLVPPE